MTREELDGYVKRMSRMLYACAFRILRDKEASEDAVQEVFARLWKMGEKTSSYESIEALSVTMVRNYCIDQLRRSKKIIAENLDSVETGHLRSETPLELIEKNESERIIEKLIGSMPDLYRNILILHDIKGLQYDEIAEKTGQNINTLRVTISRARAYLRDEYKKYYNEKRGIGQAAGKIL